MGRFYDDLFVCKVLVIGDATVGKSSLIDKYVSDKFSIDTFSTIGVDFQSITLSYMNTNIKLQIWDTAGQERFRSIVISYYREADCVILCYDITNRDSFISLESWYGTIKKSCAENTIVFMVGTKLDHNRERSVTQAEALEFAANHNFQYCELSAKEFNRDVINEQLFTPIVKALYERDKEIIDRGSTEINIDHYKNKEKSSCC
jgi:small GTP-binding protein